MAESTESFFSPEEESRKKREEIKKQLRKIREKAYADDSTEDDRDWETIAKFDVYSSDKDIAMATFEFFDTFNDPFGIEMVFEYGKNEDVKNELAKRLNLIFDLEKQLKQAKTRQWGVDEFKTQLELQKKAVQKMMEKSKGETRKIIENKLKEFEEEVAKLEM